MGEKKRGGKIKQTKKKHEKRVVLNKRPQSGKKGQLKTKRN